MIFQQCAVAGAWEISPAAHQDDRGRFMRAWCQREFAEHGIDFAPLQANIACSTRAGTLRGLHWQVAPALEAKLVRCTRGVAFDVIADLRPYSPTFQAWYGVYLSAENAMMLYVPEGCAHGCLSMVDDTDIHYMASAVFAPAQATGIRFDDPAIGIRWPAPVTTVSDQDRSWPLFQSRPAITASVEPT
jgi:dTDP-4-dehydrorhamnose 3,5-epimerase